MSYNYLCKNCGKKAKKPPVEPHKPNEPALATLGTWHCTCQKEKVKVTRCKG